MSGYLPIEHCSFGENRMCFSPTLSGSKAIFLSGNPQGRFKIKACKGKNSRCCKRIQLWVQIVPMKTAKEMQRNRDSLQWQMTSVVLDLESVVEEVKFSFILMLSFTWKNWWFNDIPLHNTKPQNRSLQGTPSKQYQIIF